MLYAAVTVRDIRFGTSGVSLGFSEEHGLDSSEGLPGVLEWTATSLEAAAFSNLFRVLLSFSKLTVVFLQLA